MTDEFRTVNFTIICKKNEDIYQEGFVEIPFDEDEPPEFFYLGSSGIPQPRQFTHHDGVGIEQRSPTIMQNAAINRFLEMVNYELADMVDEVIFNYPDGIYEVEDLKIILGCE